MKIESGKLKTKVLFVCTGNICRSPMAQVIFGNLCKNKKVTVKGAGTGAGDGWQMTREALAALKYCGEKVPRKPLLATRFDKAMIKAYDHIITMTQAHADFIGKHPNVKTLDEFTGCGDIMDPYMYPLDVYIDVCKKLQGALKILYKEIVKR